MPPDTAVHQELRLPNPTASADHQLPPPRPPMEISSDHVSWLEVRRSPEGGIHYYLGAPTTWELSLTFTSFKEVYPGAQLDASGECPFGPHYRTTGYLLRGVPNPSHHYFPMQLLVGADRGGRLVELLSAPGLEGHDIALQILYQRAPSWERGFLSHRAQHHAQSQDPRFQALVSARQAEPAYHVEVRAGLLGPTPRSAYVVLRTWLWSWLASQGGPWWSFRDVKPSKQGLLYDAIAFHDIDKFAAKKVRRDLSASELSSVLPIPWKERYPRLVYSGAPIGRIPLELVASPTTRPDLVVGYNGADWVRLPPEWNHLAILGRTRSGKSTLAQNIVRQILVTQPDAKVIVLEPTGNLIRELASRLPRNVASNAVEIDPAHPTFEQDGEEMATVPLNLLHLPDRRGIDGSEFERRAERLSGDLLQSIKNAWGEDSVGGRADFILRTLFQGLLAVEGTNLVDAYYGPVGQVRAPEPGAAVRGRSAEEGAPDPSPEARLPVHHLLARQGRQDRDESAPAQGALPAIPPGTVRTTAGPPTSPAEPRARARWGRRPPASSARSSSRSSGLQCRNDRGRSDRSTSSWTSSTTSPSLRSRTCSARAPALASTWWPSRNT